MPTDGVACEDATARDELGLVLGRQLGGFARSVRIPSLKTHGKRWTLEVWFISGHGVVMRSGKFQSLLWEALSEVDVNAQSSSINLQVFTQTA